jgi:hypothetical protein
MSYYLPGIFALFVAAAGWFYLFYSRAAERLEGIENQALNHRRRTIRRIGGVSMCLLGVAFFAGSYTFDPDARRSAFVATWLIVIILLLVVTVSGLLDLRLTIRLRARDRKQ